MKCIICNSKMIIDKRAGCYLDLAASKKEYSIYRCIKCGYRRLDPLPSTTEIDELYGSTYFEDAARGYSYADQMTESNAAFAVTAENFSKQLSKDATVLDVGCATGTFMLLLKDAGVQVMGIELSDYGVDACRQRGLKVAKGDMFSPEFDSWCVQGVHISHVFEHLRDPREALLRVRHWLNPGGILYLEVPLQFDGWLEKLQRLRGIRSKFGVFSLHHCSFFSPQSLLLLLDQCGFDVDEVTTYIKEKRKGRAKGVRTFAIDSILSIANHWHRGEIIAIWARAR